MGTESSQLPLGLCSSWDELWRGDGDGDWGRDTENTGTRIKSGLLSSSLDYTDGAVEADPPGLSVLGPDASASFKRQVEGGQTLVQVC